MKYISLSVLSLLLFLLFNNNLYSQPALKSFAVVSMNMNGGFNAKDSVAYSFSGGRTYTTDDVFNDRTGMDGQFYFNRIDFLAPPFDSAYIAYGTTIHTYLKWYNSTNQLIKSCISGSVDTTKYLYGITGELLASYHLNAKDTFIYNGSNLMAHLSYEYTGSWVLVGKELYMYDINNDLIHKIDTVWSGSGYNSVGCHYTYGSSHKLLSVYQNQVNTFTIDSTRTFYYYNSSNQCDTVTGDIWWGGTWQALYKRVFIYAGGKRVLCRLNNSLIEKAELAQVTPSLSETKRLRWDPTSSTWVNYINYDSVYRLYYDVPAAIENTPDAKNVKCNLYPVPASSYLQIDLQQNESNPISFAIYNMDGRLISKWEEKPQTELKKQVPLDNLPIGQYVLYINNSKEELYKRFEINR